MSDEHANDNGGPTWQQQLFEQSYPNAAQPEPEQDEPEKPPKK